MIKVVGGGFAGVEAAWAAANRGQQVELYEMRPSKMTPAHQTDFLAELVCSNSFKSLNPDSPSGQLKSEMDALGSIMLNVARKHAVPGGEALCVERNGFANEVTDMIQSHPNIRIVREEWTPEKLTDDITIIATGPLTSETLSNWLISETGNENLYFYDAVSPTIEADSLDMTIVWEQSRYDKGDSAYINCPFTKDEYDAFIDALLEADQAVQHEFEQGKYFEGCMPIEEIARRGRESLAFGNFKPVGLTDPRTGKRPHAVVQLRPENREKTLYSMVACQTRMKWGDQKRVLSMIPGLKSAEFVRMGVIHRNTYLNSPLILNGFLQFQKHPNMLFAGQITGVEGYVESGAIGILAGINATFMSNGEQLLLPPRASAYGCLISHVTNKDTPDFSPMNINWGLFPKPDVQIRDKGARRIAQLTAARKAFHSWHEEIKSPSVRA